jgi:hypothetical protein
MSDTCPRPTNPWLALHVLCSCRGTMGHGFPYQFSHWVHPSKLPMWVIWFHSLCMQVPLCSNLNAHWHMPSQTSHRSCIMWSLGTGQVHIGLINVNNHISWVPATDNLPVDVTSEVHNNWLLNVNVFCALWVTHWWVILFLFIRHKTRQWRIARLSWFSWGENLGNSMASSRDHTAIPHSWSCS